ncbi:MAG: fibronectin type III-like domain-contianing protein, partial [Actinomycetia bacterium]|nr:fibronectin type III-like domain-contianing protein [Actinomycetes bacterium]
GQLQHEYQSLATWAKTDLLLPDQSQELRLQLDFCQLAAYDESQACWRLEAGDYLLCLGENSRQTQTVAVVRLDQAVITEVCSNICPLTTALETIAPPARMQLTPQTQPTQLSWPKASQADPSATERLPQQLTIRAAAIPTVRHDYQPRNPQLSPAAQTVMNQLSPTEMIQVVVASGLMDNHPAFNVPGAAAYTTSALVDKGLPTAALCDGPAGLRLSRTLVLDRRGRLKPVEPAMELLGYLPGPLRRWLLGNPRAGEPRYQYASAFPVGTALAQTWNLALIEELGQAIGREMTEFGVSFLLAPGLNIQRNPLCGRNYEYFSEDPLLSGRMAAALTRGVQSWPGCYVTIKHFAANNQETDRQRSNSVVGERALREIYLKGFGLAVAAGAQAVMTSYNRVNGVYTANSWDLCSKVLRLEWGFNGLVMTDWLACAPDLAGHGAAIQAGNDLICPGGGGSRRALRQDLAAGRVSLAALRESCGRVVELVLRGRTAAAMRESLECENQD